MTDPTITEAEVEAVADDDAFWKAACRWVASTGNDMRPAYRKMVRAALLAAARVRESADPNETAVERAWRKRAEKAEAERDAALADAKAYANDAENFKAWMEDAREERDENFAEGQRIIALYRDRTAVAEAERDAAKSILSKCADAIGNGAVVSPDCSIEFMSCIPREIGLHVASLTEDLGETKEQRDEARADAFRVEAERDALRLVQDRIVKERDAARAQADALAGALRGVWAINDHVDGVCIVVTDHDGVPFRSRVNEVVARMLPLWNDERNAALGAYEAARSAPAPTVSQPPPDETQAAQPSTDETLEDMAMVLFGKLAVDTTHGGHNAIPIILAALTAAEARGAEREREACIVAIRSLLGDVYGILPDNIAAAIRESEGGDRG